MEKIKCKQPVPPIVYLLELRLSWQTVMRGMPHQKIGLHSKPLTQSECQPGIFLLKPNCSRVEPPTEDHVRKSGVGGRFEILFPLTFFDGVKPIPGAYSKSLWFGRVCANRASCK